MPEMRGCDDARKSYEEVKTKMPYKKINDLPKKVKDNLPKGAQNIFMKAFNNAWENYKYPADRQGHASREAVVNKVAWAAVKKKYKKNSKGEWVKK